MLRRSLQETEEFLERKRERHHPTPSEILRALAHNWRIVLIGMLMVTMTTVSFYFITAYTPTFGKEVLNLSSTESLLVTLCVGISNLFWLPVMGAVSDRVGRRPLLIIFTRADAGDAPIRRCHGWSARRRSSGCSTVELWLSFLYGSYNGAMVVSSPRSCRCVCARRASRSPTASRPRCSAASRRPSAPI